MLAKLSQQRAPGRVGECCKGTIQRRVLILYHMVKH
jgi:hypothetical protein